MTDELVAERLRKVSELADRGVSAYGVDFRPDTTLIDAVRQLAELEVASSTAAQAATEAAGATRTTPPLVRVAGRIMQLRMQGKSCFVHIEDEHGRLQAWFTLDRLGPFGFDTAKLLDLGDIIGVRGALMRTRRGEPTVAADELILLVKALRPPPDKYHGLRDRETRYRKRHLDLLANIDRRHQFATRSKIVTAIRRVLDDRGFLEVETPLLQSIPGGANATPFVTHWNSLHTDVYLRIAIELHLKRLLVGGYGRVYEIGRVFRNEGLSPRHNPEFTLLEAYEAYGDYTTMRTLTEALVIAAAEAAGPDSTTGDALCRSVGGRELDLRPPFRTVRMVDLVAEACDLDPLAAWEAGRLPEEARRRGVACPPGVGPGGVLLELYERFVEHTLWAPTFVLDYPAEVSPLARRHRTDPRFVERFELIAGGRELANAFSELNDPIDQRRRFIDQAAKRTAGDTEAHPVDEEFLEALEAGMPPAGGLGIGIDRLVMLITDASAIRDVLLFPMMRPHDHASSDAGAGAASDAGAAAREKETT